MMREPEFSTRLATTEAERLAAERLRYDVFVKELGANGPLVDHESNRERDRFDAYAEQLLLLDEARGACIEEQVVGVYRLMDAQAAAEAGQFYSEGEYDLSVLKASGRKLLELGRSCLHKDYRGGGAMVHLWGALARLVEARGVEILFGVASFHGTDAKSLAEPLSLLHHRHLAPEPLRVRARGDGFWDMAMRSEAELDRRAAMRAVPALIKAYLWLGGVVGEGAYIDRAFNTIDVCLILDTALAVPKRRALYEGRT